MDPYEEEAFRAKQIAERRFCEKDFTGARSYALKARSLFPNLEGISQMVATFEVFIASQSKYNGGIDYYAVLGLNPSAGKREVKKQYKKLAMLLHPDKNKCIGAEGAFQLVSEAWAFLSNEFKKSTFYYKRKKNIDDMAVQRNNSAEYVSGPASERLDTFWTVCTSCKVQYEYLRKYVNKRLSCKNCRGAFIAVETGPGPVSASFHCAATSHTPSHAYKGHGNDGPACLPSGSPFYIGHYPGHGYDYVTDGSYEWGPYSGTAPGDGYKLSNGVVSRGRRKVHDGSNGTCSMKSTTTDLIHWNSPDEYADSSAVRTSGPEKKRRVVLRCDEKFSKPGSEPRTHMDTNIEHEFKLPTRRWSAAPAVDTRKLLVSKARTFIQKELEILRLASDAASMANRTPVEIEGSGTGKSVTTDHHQLVRTMNGPMSITVPDPDFHDFDKNRSEECFKARQIWAIYDEDDGMPRLYCMVREVVSVQPFKINIAYLSSKTDAEFGSMKWVHYGFTKSCGHFRIQHSERVEQVNIFSHLLNGKKTGRGGCVRIFPTTGEIWAVYKNWSPSWNTSTLDEVRHQYEMVEILGEYTEEYGVRIVPLVKLEGFKTVYRRSTREDSKRWIPRREMLRFSHQVPSWFLKQDTSGLPGNCWDLDPAAIPEALLHTRAGID